MHIPRLLGGRWQPDRLGGLILWLDAGFGVLNASGNPAADLDPVKDWRDRSPQSNHFGTSSSSRRPVYRTGVVNGRAVLRFDGVDDTMGASANITGAAFTIAAVFDDTGSGSAERAVCGFIQGSLYARQYATANWGVYAEVAQDIDGGVDVGATHQLCVAVARSASDIDLVTDGSLVNRTNGSGWPSRSGTTVGSEPTPLQYHNGDIAEVVVYNRALAAGERRKLERYLGRKYGIGVA